jgi:hypothetical protein
LDFAGDELIRVLVADQEGLTLQLKRERKWLYMRLIVLLILFLFALAYLGWRVYIQDSINGGIASSEGTATELLSHGREIL